MIELLYGDVAKTYRSVYENGGSVKDYDNLRKLYLESNRLQPPDKTWIPAILWEKRSIGGRDLDVYLQTMQHAKEDRLCYFTHLFAFEPEEHAEQLLPTALLYPHFADEAVFASVAASANDGKPGRKPEWDPLCPVPATEEVLPLDAHARKVLLLTLLERGIGRTVHIALDRPTPEDYTGACLSILRQLFARLPLPLRHDLSFCTCGEAYRDGSSALVFWQPDTAPSSALNPDALPLFTDNSELSVLATFLAEAGQNELEAFSALIRRCQTMAEKPLFTAQELTRLLLGCRAAEGKPLEELLQLVLHQCTQDEEEMNSPELLAAIDLLQRKLDREAIDRYFAGEPYGDREDGFSRFIDDWISCCSMFPDWQPKEIKDRLKPALRKAAVRLDHIEDFKEKSELCRDLPHGEVLPVKAILEGFTEGFWNRHCAEEGLGNSLELWSFLAKNETARWMDESGTVRDTCFQEKLTPKLNEYLLSVLQSSRPLTEKAYLGLEQVHQICPEYSFPERVIEKVAEETAGNARDIQSFNESVRWYARLKEAAPRLDLSRCAERFFRGQDDRLRREPDLRRRLTGSEELLRYLQKDSTRSLVGSDTYPALERFLTESRDDARRSFQNTMDRAQRTAAEQIRAITWVDLGQADLRGVEETVRIYPELKDVVAEAYRDAVTKLLQAQVVTGERDLQTLEDKGMKALRSSLLRVKDIDSIRELLSVKRDSVTKYQGIDPVSACYSIRSNIDSSKAGNDRETQQIVNILADQIRSGTLLIRANNSGELNAQLRAYNHLISAIPLSKEQRTVQVSICGGQVMSVPPEVLTELASYTDPKVEIQSASSWRTGGPGTRNPRTAVSGTRAQIARAMAAGGFFPPSRYIELLQSTKAAEDRATVALGILDRLLSGKDETWDEYACTKTVEALEFNENVWRQGVANLRQSIRKGRVTGARERQLRKCFAASSTLPSRLQLSSTMQDGTRLRSLIAMPIALVAGVAAVLLMSRLTAVSFHPLQLIALVPVILLPFLMIRDRVKWSTVIAVGLAAAFCAWLLICGVGLLIPRESGELPEQVETLETGVLTEGRDTEAIPEEAPEITAPSENPTATVTAD